MHNGRNGIDTQGGNGELDMLGYVMLNPELKEPFSDYARGNGITCPTAADAVRF